MPTISYNSALTLSIEWITQGRTPHLEWIGHSTVQETLTINSTQLQQKAITTRWKVLKFHNDHRNGKITTS